MKKLLLLLPAFLLVGCSSAKSVAFKELKYDKPLNAKQLEEFNEKFSENLKKVKTLKIQTVVEEKHGFVERSAEGEATYTLYTNGVKMEGLEKVDSKDNGVSYSTKETGTMNSWIINKDGFSKTVTVSTESESDEVDIDVNDYEPEDVNLGYVAMLLGLKYSELDQLRFYQNGKDYAVVFSSEIKHVTDASDFAGQKKDLIETTNRQLVIDVDKEYKIKSASYIMENGSNRDQDTLEWYNKVKNFETEQTSMKVTYGNLETRNESELFDILRKENKEYLVSVKPSFRMGYYDGVEVPAAASFSLVQLDNVIVNEDKDQNEVDYRGRFTITNTSNAFLKDIKAEVTYLSKDGFVTKTTETAGTISGYAGLTSASTSDATPVDFMYDGYGVYADVNFVLEFTLSIGSEISFLGNPSVTFSY